MAPRRGPCPTCGRGCPPGTRHCGICRKPGHDRRYHERDNWDIGGSRDDDVYDSDDCDTAGPFRPEEDFEYIFQRLRLSGQREEELRRAAQLEAQQLERARELERERQFEQARQRERLERELREREETVRARENAVRAAEERRRRDEEARAAADRLRQQETTSGRTTPPARPPSNVNVFSLPEEAATRPPIAENFIIPYEDISFDPSSEPLGSGSFGDVILGTWHNAPVAVKKLRSQGMTNPAIETFNREVKVLASVNHPNVVQFYGACTQRPNLAIVMEYLSGGSLWDIMYTGEVAMNWDLERKTQIIRQAASGMLYLHSKGIVHRDIKSHNLLLSSSTGTAKVADFGLAKARNSTMASSTRRGGAPGTPLWSAPEVFAGRVAGQPGWEKADMYGFAILCSEILTGQLPYADSDWDENELRRHVAEGERPDLAQANLPGGLVNLVKRGWAANPDERSSFAQFILDLDAGRNGETVPGGASPGARAPRLCMICLARPRNAKLRPCDHAVACHDCCLQLMERGRQLCPVCRAPFSEIRQGTNFLQTYCPE